jgi:hypothetical protein
MLFYLGPSHPANTVAAPADNVVVAELDQPAQLVNNETALSLLYKDQAGATQFQKVQLGTALTVAANGMPIGARALYVTP